MKLAQLMHTADWLRLAASGLSAPDAGRWAATSGSSRPIEILSVVPLWHLPAHPTRHPSGDCRRMIQNLLTHTSGTSDWIQPWDGARGKPSNSLQLVEQIKYTPPYFKPGEKSCYSDNGYIILGYIIEKVANQPYETFLQQRVFEPLGMRNSGYDDNNVAVGYRTIGIKGPALDLLFRYSASGLYSSVDDLYLWDQALYGEQLIPQEYLNMMFTGYAKTPSLDFYGAYYGYGWFIGNILNRSVVVHGGSMSGFTAMLMRFPDERVTIIVLRNYGVQVYDRLGIEPAKIVFDET
jgi:CubicO group peptidase (beta-lactamase class C family)